MKCVEDGSDVFILSHSHQDPSSAVLDILQLLQTLVGDPDEKSVAVIQSRGDEGVDQFLSIS